jgi:RNA recognition motif-containing protein
MGGPDRQKSATARRSNQPYARERIAQRAQTSARNTEDPADKKPCRVLFVRNVDYTTTELDVKNLFTPYGEIKTVFDLIAKRGLVFVTYVC